VCVNVISVCECEYEFVSEWVSEWVCVWVRYVFECDMCVSDVCVSVSVRVRVCVFVSGPVSRWVSIWQKDYIDRQV